MFGKVVIIVTDFSFDEGMSDTKRNQKTLDGKRVMKALSVREPWAGLIRNGKKTIETRTWNTNYRGDLLICASANPKTGLSGKAVCIVEVVDCRPMEKSDEMAACCEIYPNAKAWILRNIRPITPFPVKGQLQIFEVCYMISEEPTFTCTKCNKPLTLIRNDIWKCLNCNIEKHPCYKSDTLPTK